MVNLILSIAILGLAPALCLAISKASYLLRAEKYMFWTIVAAILIGFLPEHIEHDGYISIVFLAGSTAVYHFLEKGAHRLNDKHSRYALFWFSLLVLIHALADGLGLGITEHLGFSRHHGGHSHADEVLAYSIILHRLPAGIGIWSFLYPRFGWKQPTMVFLVIAGGTIAGYLIASQEAAQLLEGPQLHFLEYMIAGGLLHFGVHAARGKHHEANS